MRFLVRLRQWWTRCDSPEPCRTRLEHRGHIRVVEALNRMWEQR